MMQSSGRRRPSSLYKLRLAKFALRSSASAMANDPQVPATALAALFRILDLEPLEQNLYRGVSPKEGWQRVYGGQVLGQALVAATRTVERAASRTFAARLFPSRRAILRTRSSMRWSARGTARSFSTRRVKAIQNGRSIFTMAVSFHKPEDGFDHQAEMPSVAAARIAAERNGADDCS